MTDKFFQQLAQCKMKLLIFSVLWITATLSHAQDRSQDILSLLKQKCTPSNEYKQMNSWFTKDQEHREKVGRLFEEYRSRGESPPQEALRPIVQNMMTADEQLRGELDAFVMRCGWPFASFYGNQASLNAFIIVQHGPIEYIERYINTLRVVARLGELKRSRLAALEDRLRVKKGQPQLFGTQVQDGSPIRLFPVEDMPGLDARRAQMGLIPICSYLQTFVNGNERIDHPGCDSHTPAQISTQSQASDRR